MSFAAILSAEYADSCWPASRATSTRNRSAPGRSCSALPERLADPLHRQQTVLGPEPVKLDNLIFAINTDASVRVQKLKAGECQVTLHPRPADLTALKADPKLQLLSKPGFNLGYIAYNVRHKPFDQLEVRQALDMAVNKQASSTPFTRARATGGQRHAADPVVLRRQHQGRRLRPGKAKALLKAAGVKEGTEITLWAMPVQRPYNPNAKLMAEMLQATGRRSVSRSRSSATNGANTSSAPRMASTTSA
jgi:dipeptide transport system substrate-binding protein